MNIFNHKLRVLFVSVVIVLLTACDINRLPETQISDESFWTSTTDLRLATNYLYTFLPRLPSSSDYSINDVPGEVRSLSPATDDIWSDDAAGKATDAISDGSRLVPGSDGFYKYQYRLIRAANNIIEKSNQVFQSGVSQSDIDPFLGEARFFRAMAYFSLFQRYGGVPLILKTLVETDPELYSAQASRDEVLTAIYADLDFAASVLPLPSAINVKEYGKVSKTAAWALKARVALFEGTRAKFHGYGNATNHLTLARDAALNVINSTQHSLYSSYYKLFQIEGDGPSNKENILVRIYGANESDRIIWSDVQRQLEQGAASPTKALADAYLMTDGLPTDKSPNYSTPTTILEVFKDRDPRMSNTFLKKGDTYINTQPVFNIPALNFQRTGFANRRYINLEMWKNQRSYIDLAILRYNEVLLNYAEAVFELNGTITDQELNMSINVLRTRASMPALTNSFVTTNTLDMRDEIRRERRVELALGGFRYWDLIRWKTAEIELPKPMLGNYYFAEFGTAVVPNVDENNFIIVQNASLRKFNPARDYLWPFPSDELSLNPNLVQNPNWN
jgi:starch-binding outer membrane protein, SusD/RagB family